MKDLGRRHRAPIAFFAYNRPPKRSKDKKAVNRVREIAKSYNWCGAGSFLAKQLRRCER
jgi:hypothetical protein